MATCADLETRRIIHLGPHPAVAAGELRQVRKNPGCIGTAARNLRIASFWRGLQTINGKASSLGNFEVFTGDYENLFKIPERLSAITPGELQAVAASVFRTENMTVGILRPPSEGASE